MLALFNKAMRKIVNVLQAEREHAEAAHLPAPTAAADASAHMAPLEGEDLRSELASGAADSLAKMKRDAAAKQARCAPRCAQITPRACICPDIWFAASRRYLGGISQESWLSSADLSRYAIKGSEGEWASALGEFSADGPPGRLTMKTAAGGQQQQEAGRGGKKEKRGGGGGGGRKKGRGK